MVFLSILPDNLTRNFIISIFLFIICATSTSFCMISPTLEWVSCNVLSKQTRKIDKNSDLDLSFLLHDPILSLAKFKKYFKMKVDSHKKEQESPNQRIWLSDVDINFHPKLPTSDAEWKVVQANYLSSQCTLSKVPFLWDEPNENNFTRVFVKRFLASKQPAKAQLWLLQGGPGSESSIFDEISSLYFMNNMGNDVDIYIPEQRGVGRSDLLKCSVGAVANSNGYYEYIQTCVKDWQQKYGKNGLFGFAPRQFAKDIVWISNSSKPIENLNQKVLIYGVSYGTYLLNEALKLFPDYFEAAIADSVLSLTQKWEYRDLYFEDTLQELIKDCEQSEFCSGKFRSLGHAIDVRKAFEIVLKKTDARSTNKCNLLNNLPLSYLRSFLSSATDVLNYRRLIFPLVYRIYRCDSEKDRNFLDNFFWMIGVTRAVDMYPTNTLFNATISRRNQEFSERFGDDESLYEKLFGTKTLRSYTNDEINQIAKQPTSNYEIFFLIAFQELTSNVVNRTMMDYYSTYKNLPPHGNPQFDHYHWTIYGMTRAGARYENPYPIEYAKEYKKPLLIMHGTWDDRTPRSMGEEWFRVFNASNPNNTIFLLFNHTRHAQIFVSYEKQFGEKKFNIFSPTVNFDYANDVCGAKILIEFVKRIVSGDTDIRSSLQASCYHDRTYAEALEADFGSKISYLETSTFPKMMVFWGTLGWDVDFWEGKPLYSLNDLLTTLDGLLLPGFIISTILCFPCCCICFPCVILCALFGLYVLKPLLWDAIIMKNVIYYWNI